MNDTLDKLKVRRAVLLYLSQRIGDGNFTELQRQCMIRDQQRSGCVTCQDFLTCFELSGMNVLPREFDELQGELDPQKTGRINYELFLTSVFMT